MSKRCHYVFTHKATGEVKHGFGCIMTDEEAKEEQQGKYGGPRGSYTYHDCEDPEIIKVEDYDYELVVEDFKRS